MANHHPDLRFVVFTTAEELHRNKRERLFPHLEMESRIVARRPSILPVMEMRDRASDEPLMYNLYLEAIQPQHSVTRFKNDGFLPMYPNQGNNFKSEDVDVQFKPPKRPELPKPALVKIWWQHRRLPPPTVVDMT